MKRETGKRRPAIITPFADLLCCGGLSLVGIAGFLLYAWLRPGDAPAFTFGSIFILSAAVNWPHFMASYRLLYQSRAQIMGHKSASCYVPGILLAVLLYALLSPQSSTPGALDVNTSVGYGLFLVSAFYLAWHYTGQAWGMIASFAFLSGIRMDSLERHLIRSGQRLLLVWHVVWGAEDLKDSMGPLAGWFHTAYVVLSLVGLATALLGIWGFWRIWKRTGIKPGLRMIAPWASIYLWYTLLYFYPAAFFWVQISHALQYIIFPVRVELNRSARQGGKQTVDPTTALLRAIGFYSLLVVAGLLVFYAPSKLIVHADARYNLAALVAACVNIHHYFVDGVIWKISNPAVRRDLFAHVPKGGAPAT